MTTASTLDAPSVSQALADLQRNREALMAAAAPPVRRARPGRDPMAATAQPADNPSASARVAQLAADTGYQPRREPQGAADWMAAYATRFLDQRLSNQPLYAMASQGLTDAERQLAPLARKHPVAVVAGAALVGVALARIAPRKVGWLAGLVLARHGQQALADVVLGAPTAAMPRDRGFMSTPRS